MLSVVLFLRIDGVCVSMMRIIKCTELFKFYLNDCRDSVTGNK